MALNLERGEKYGSKPGLHNRDHSKEDSSLCRNTPRGEIFVKLKFVNLKSESLIIIQNVLFSMIRV